jgi:hypothetical protein
MKSAGDEGPVDESDDDADGEPFDEVSDGLLEGESGADIEIDVVVDDEGADGEDADEGAEACTLRKAGAGLVEHGVENGQNEHGYEHGEHAGRHDGFDALRRAVNGGIFQELAAERGHQTECEPAKKKISNESTERCKSNASGVHEGSFLRREDSRVRKEKRSETWKCER